MNDTDKACEQPNTPMPHELRQQQQQTIPHEQSNAQNTRTHNHPNTQTHTHPFVIWSNRKATQSTHSHASHRKPSNTSPPPPRKYYI